MLVGYVRVSTADERQSTDLQRDALRAAGVDERHVYEDKASGGRDDRPGPEGLPGVPEERRRAGGLAPRPARPLPAPPGRDRGRPAGPRRRAALALGDHRHHDRDRRARVPPLRQPRPVRAGARSASAWSPGSRRPGAGAGAAGGRGGSTPSGSRRRGRCWPKAGACRPRPGSRACPAPRWPTRCAARAHDGGRSRARTGGGGPGRAAGTAARSAVPDASRELAARAHRPDRFDHPATHAQEPLVQVDRGVGVADDELDPLADSRRLARARQLDGRVLGGEP